MAAMKTRYDDKEPNLAIYRVQIAFPVDTTLPVDHMTINPHYSGDDAQALVDRLKSNLLAFVQVGATKPFIIKAYDAQKAPPSYPLATANNAGTPIVSSAPRELALCLSYFSTWNRPRYRGRLYIPYQMVGGVIGPRPADAQLATTLSWKGPLTESLPPAHNLVVYSRANQAAYGVDNFWVDDEWDVVRSRGRKPTKRVTGTFP
jgi:hypothetical protein